MPVMPRRSSTPIGPVSINTISTAPTATSVEPTARSMPPEMITKVMPSAMMPMPELLRRMLIQFCHQVANQLPNESNSKPSARVCRMIITTSAAPVLNSGRVDHMLPNQEKTFWGFWLFAAFMDCLFLIIWFNLRLRPLPAA